MEARSQPTCIPGDLPANEAISSSVLVTNITRERLKNGTRTKGGTSPEAFEPDLNSSLRTLEYHLHETISDLSECL